MEKRLKTLVPLACFQLLFSCTDAGPEWYGQAGEPEPDLSDYVISGEDLKLYAGLGAYNRAEECPGTKSSEQESYPLSELLDYGKATTEYFHDTPYTQIPFKQNDSERIWASLHRLPSTAADSCMLVKKYLVESRWSDGTPAFAVVTMVPEKGLEHPEEFDFLHKGNFSGICIFSSLGRNRVCIERYVGGCAVPTEILLSEEPATAETEYLSLIEVIETKGEGDSIPIDGSVCIGYRWLNPSYCYGGTGGGSSSGSGGPSKGISGGRDNRLLTRKIDSGDELLPEEDLYSMTVITNTDGAISFLCNGRSYAKGSTVFVMPDLDVPYDPDCYSFTGWAGDFAGQKKDSFSLEIEQEYCSIAYYNMPLPCIDKSTGKRNPLTGMKVAPAGGWNYYGGTYGKTRNGGKKPHGGVDFEAVPGTPVFSMYAGTVTKVVDSYVNTQKDGTYGNEIYVESEFKGVTITIQYAHLQAGTPVAGNPFTGTTIKVGDYVLQGQLIGYTGKTGNAFDDDDVPNKHLHLGVRSGGKWIDPAPYVNGDIDAGRIMERKGRIYNIKCD